MKIVLTRCFPGEVLSRLRKFYDEVVEYELGRPLGTRELARALSDADCVVVTVTDKVDRVVLEKAKKLKAIFSFSVGVDHVGYLCP
jgi:glyoxylate reductase